MGAAGGVKSEKRNIEAQRFRDAEERFNARAQRRKDAKIFESQKARRRNVS
jgi:hypothetical protein